MRRAGGFVSIGYEGREIGEFVAELTHRDVALLADVRLRASSRRRGFAKTALRAALADAGIDYLHLPELGNPRDNRDAFRAGMPAAHLRYRGVLEEPAAVAALQRLSELAAARTVAVMCVEHDESRCHRAEVLDALGRSA